MKKLSQHVYVVDEDGRDIVLKPGDSVPSWAKDQVTNPKAFAADEDVTEPAAPVGDVPPPKAGSGSGVAAWKAYAAAKGVEVADDAKREEIISALDAAGHATEPQQ